MPDLLRGRTDKSMHGQGYNIGEDVNGSMRFNFACQTISALILATLLLAPLPHVVAGNANWRFGTARVEITPTEPMSMAGYGGRDGPAEGQLTPLWAKALVLQDADGRRVVLVTLDLVGIGRPTMQLVCEQLHQQYDLQREQVALCASHTHTGPALADTLRPLHYFIVDRVLQQRIDDYTGALRDQIVQLVGRALDSMQPGSLSWGNGTATFAVNRRNNSESEVPRLRSDGKLQGPIDHDVPVLAIRDEAGQLKAIVFGYACHATVLSFYQWSGDYPGFAQIELEKAHPDCQAMFWAGCGADQNPLPRRTVEYAKQYGGRLAAAVDRALGSGMKTMPPRLRATYNEIDLPLAELPTREAIEQDTKSDNQYTRARARSLLKQMADHGGLDESYPYPVQTWQIGDDVQWVFLGGEVVVDYALRLKQELRGTNTWVAGYANDVMAYIPSRRVLNEGGYEGGEAMVYYGLPTTWAPAVEEEVVRSVHEQLD